MSQKIKLTEKQLYGIIKESVKSVLKEYDEPFPYDYKDARERDAYYQRAVQHDFPADSRFKTGRSWEDMYNDLSDKKAAKEKEDLKLQKQKARDEKKQQAIQKKSQTAEKKEKMYRTWAKAVHEALTGSDDENDNYDGLMDFPLILKDGSQVMFHAHSFMRVSDEFANTKSGYFNGYGSREFDNFSFGLAGTVDGVEENVELYLTVGVYVSPMTTEILNIKCSLDGIHNLRTKIAITNLAKKEAIKRYKFLTKTTNNIK